MFYLVIFFFILGFFLVVSAKKINLPINKIILLAVLTRIFVIVFFPKSISPDLQSAVEAGQLILTKKSAYPFLYLPFFPYLGVLALWVKNLIDPLLFLKIFFSLFDVLIVYLIYLISNSRLAALLFAINPVALLATTIHGQFDTIPLFLFLLAIYLLKKRKELASILFLSASIWTKTWPALFMFPLLWKMRNKWLWLVVPLLPLAVMIFHSLVFDVPIMKIIFQIKNYRGVYGVWGFGQIMHALTPNYSFINDPGFIRFFRRLFLISFFVFAVWPRPKKITDTVYQIMLFFFSFTITFGAGWLSWITPFIILTRQKYYQFFFILATVYLSATFYGDANSEKGILPIKLFFINIFGLALWLTMIWFFRRSFNRSK